MKKAYLRLISLAVAALFAVMPHLVYATVIQGNEPIKIPKFYWFMAYDRTPNAYKERFNDLSQEWLDDEDIKYFTVAPGLGYVRSTGYDSFAFFSDGSSQKMHTDYAGFAISGTMNEQGKIVRLSLETTPIGEIGSAYASAAESIVYLSVFSLFDELTERAARNLSLFLLYDVRPFDQHKILKVGKRSAVSVIKGDRLSVSWEVTSDSAFKVIADIHTGSTDDELQASKYNNQVNRTLSTASTECGTFLDYLREMKRLAALENVRWSDLGEVCDQIRECIISANECANALLGFDKSREYATSLKASLADIKVEVEQLSGLIIAGDLAGFEEFLSTMSEHVRDMYYLIGIVRAS